MNPPVDQNTSIDQLDALEEELISEMHHYEGSVEESAKGIAVSNITFLISSVAAIVDATLNLLTDDYSDLAPTLTFYKMSAFMAVSLIVKIQYEKITTRIRDTLQPHASTRPIGFLLATQRADLSEKIRKKLIKMVPADELLEMPESESY